MKIRQFQEIIKTQFRMRQVPLVLQMPITSRCNSRCKTCNVWKSHDNNDIDPQALGEVLKDSFFSEVRSVGLNGGELTLVPKFLEILENVLTLPKIKNLYCISNGLFPKRLFEYLEKAKELCNKRGVHLHICISVDGYGKVQENVRGVPNSFKKTQEVIETLYSHREKYCDSFSVGCTISIHNIDNIKETQSYLESFKGLAVEYHCAIPNKRIKTFENADYYVLKDDKKRLQVAEFFYERYLQSKSIQQRYQNFSNFYFLTHKGQERINTCDFLCRDVTIDENLNFMLCATASEVIGNLKEHSASELVKTKRYKMVQSEIAHYCNNCGHYSYHPLTLKGRLEYIKHDMQNRYVWSYYEIDRSNIKKNIYGHLSFFKFFFIEYFRQLYYIIWKLQ